MSPDRSVALVGRPNVGKSRLFNRLAGRRLAIVHDQPGVTRDVNSTEVDHSFTLMDTGGIGLREGVEDMEMRQLVEAAEEQVFVAIQAARIILFVVDGKDGLMPLDEMITEQLRKAGKEVWLVVNKIDNQPQESDIAEFRRLGFKDIFAVSAEHGRNVSELRKKIDDTLGPPQVGEPEERRIKLAFVGRPNVGKSSLCNRLLKSDRLVVSEVAGTTRDSVELDLDYKSRMGDVWRFRLMDTAGLRRNRKIGSPVEYFSALRSGKTAEEADVAFLVLDATTGVTTQDKNIAGQLIESGKSLVILVNKWDLAMDTFREDPLPGYKDLDDFKKRFEDAVRKELFFLPSSPVIFASALKAFALDGVLNTAVAVDQTAGMKLPTGRVNALLEKLLERRQPKIVGKKRFKIYYAVQVGNRPFRLKLFCNQPSKLDSTYERFLQKGFIDEFGLEGCPMKFTLMGKERRYADKS